MRVEANSSLISRSLQPVQAVSDAQVKIPDSLQSKDKNPESMEILSLVKEKFLNACNWVKNLLCSIFNFISCGYFSQVSPSDEVSGEAGGLSDEVEEESDLEKLLKEATKDTEDDRQLKRSWIYKLANGTKG